MNSITKKVWVVMILQTIYIYASVANGFVLAYTMIKWHMDNLSLQTCCMRNSSLDSSRSQHHGLLRSSWIDHDQSDEYSFTLIKAIRVATYMLWKNVPRGAATSW